MSTDAAFTKANLNACLSALAKEFRKLKKISILLLSKRSARGNAYND